MKGILKVLLLGVISVGMLSGCGDNSNSRARTSLEKAWKYMTPQERAIANFHIDKGYDLVGYHQAYSAILGNRTIENPLNKVAPFCDIIDLLEKLESTNDDPDYRWTSPARGHSYLTQWETFKGETLRESCAKTNSEVKAPVTEVVETVEERYTPVEEEIREQVLDDTISLKGNTLLSPEKVRELTNSVGECNTAKVQLIVTMNRGEPLTVNDYEKVSELILGCEMDLLREELNK